ncbi:MAG: hypothetical protein IJ819_09430 [Clostridiales bacterium]|nr:hypothetical protein [Clostridiales bacterium]
MNKKIIALIATGAILTTAVAAGCAAQKKTNSVNEVISALESAVVSETEPGSAEMKASVDTAETTAETTPTTEIIVSEISAEDIGLIKDVAKASAKKSSKKPAAKKTTQTKTTKPSKSTDKTTVKTTEKPAADKKTEESKLISEYDRQKYSSVVYVCDNTNVKIDATNPKRCQVTIRVKSGKNYFEYTMSGKLNRRTGVLNYTNGEKKEYVPNGRKIELKGQIFTKGQGRITFLTNGITWRDCKDGIDKTMKLTRS